MLKLFFYYTDHAVLTQLETELKALFGNTLSIMFSSMHCLEVMGPDVSKGKSLAALAQHLGKTLDDCIAFGDSLNDEAMLSMVKKGLIMDNGHERLKQALPNNKIIGHHDDDAVAQYLYAHILPTS